MKIITFLHDTSKIISKFLKANKWITYSYSIFQDLFIAITIKYSNTSTDIR